MKYIAAHKEHYGIEPICRELQVAPSTFYAAASRPPSARQIYDKGLKVEIVRVHKENFNVYGAWKVWRQLNRKGIPVGRDRIARLMPEVGLVGTVRGKVWRTTFPADVGQRPADLVDRKFISEAPNWLWVADLTYVSTWTCVAYTAFVTDVFSRYIVGWKTSTSLRTDLAIDALEMAIWARGSRDLSGLVHHSDRGVQGNISPSATPSASSTPVPSAQSVLAEIPTTMQWPNPSMRFTRPRSCASRGLGVRSSSSS